MYSAGDDPKGPGFPIRKSTDQRVLAPPRGLSQRATSFIASVRQGIHQMPLKTLDPTKSITSREKSAQRFATQSVRAGRSAPAKRLNSIPERKTHQTFIVASPPDPSAPKDRRNQKQDDSRPGKSAFYRPHAIAQLKARRRQARKPLTTNFRSTLSNNNGRQRPQGPNVRISDIPVMNDANAPRPASGWWRRTESNRRPHACKARALPTELRPLRAGQAAVARGRWWAREDLNFRPHAYQARALTN
jgi:hypothetical protein